MILGRNRVMKFIIQPDQWASVSETRDISGFSIYNTHTHTADTRACSGKLLFAQGRVRARTIEDFRYARLPACVRAFNRARPFHFCCIQ